MGRLWDKYIGTKYPDSGVTPLLAADVRVALLALNGPDVPWSVRNAFPAEKADLVAEWQIRDPVTSSLVTHTRLDRTLKTRMRLVPSKHEVRALDEQWEVRRVGNAPGTTTSRTYSRGQVTSLSREWTYERGSDGRRHKVETFRFDSRAMKNPLRDAVLAAGWTWRGVMRKL